MASTASQMRRQIIAGNWKMHGSRAENAALVESVVHKLPNSSAEVWVCPPFVYLAELSRALAGSRISLGAQDVCAETQGAFTGEVSAAMLRDVGCAGSIVGHSERRALFGESDQLVARKFAAVLGAGLTPILCVGEQLAEREAGRTFEVIDRQLDAVLDLSGVAAFTRAVIAYEPVWAIGTGKTASPQQAEDVHAHILEVAVLEHVGPRLRRVRRVARFSLERQRRRDVVLERDALDELVVEVRLSR